MADVAPPVQRDAASKKAVEQQQELLKQLFAASGTGTGLDLTQLATLQQTATFKTPAPSGGRISIPDAEREVLDIDGGDIV